MNLRNPSIVFVGSDEMDEKLEADARRRAVRLWRATGVLQALAFYMFYMPDAVLLEDGADPELTYEVYFHLSSVGAKPLIILASESESQVWKDVSGETTSVFPPSTNGESLLAAAAETTARTPSWFKKDDAVIGKDLGVRLTFCSSDKTEGSRYSRSHGSPGPGTTPSSPGSSARGG